MTIIDWLEITITFNAKCNECGKDILPGKTFWSTSKAARHLSCGNNKIDNQINKTPNVIVAQDIVETD